ncbi:MAG: bifunctional N(6)-L-threonylcarbamoyladenine synthase/serine/threonine protein kinase [Candidatus Nanoarchaeia archaeon]|nr:bifunctional N(6)-L-threonylcarbamoyladenine synthase/serine/threonine protein kinase [Candidatus Nanoarchaeia archaeon]
MICLGIESTAHTFGAGVADSKGNILSNVKDMHCPEKGGLHPREAFEHHVEVSDAVISEAVKRAGIRLSNIGRVAFSQGPGIPPCLRVGAVIARSISKKLNIPIVGVNHCVAHLEIAKLYGKMRNPAMLYVSGGNTQVIAYDSGKYRIFGETIDIGIGNAIDKFGRFAGLLFPSGPAIEQLSKKGKTYLNLPYTVKGMDVSYGGMLTNLKQKLNSGKCNLEDICYSFQETAFAMLVEVSERALAHCGLNELILTGGVGANKRLAEMCRIMCRERGAKFYVPPTELCGDNGAMIAWNGILAEQSNDTHIKQKWRTDEVDVSWLK